MTIVDVHAHILPPGVIQDWRRGRWCFPGVSVDEVGGVASLEFPTGGALAVPPALVDVEVSVARLDQQGITTALVAPWLELVGYGLPPAEGASWARFLNEHAAGFSGGGRLLPLATVPLQDGDLAAEEVVAAREAGFVGVAIGTTAGGRELDDPALAPLWDAVAESSMPLFLHPMLDRENRRIGDDFALGLANSTGRIIDTTIAVSRLLLSGTLAARPALRIVVAHGGASIPYILGRLRRTHEIASEVTADPLGGFGCLSFDTVLYDPGALRFLVEAVGPGRVLLGSDYPFPNRDPEPRRIVAEALGEGENARAVLGENAIELFKL